jgi:hypothetical protein
MREMLAESKKNQKSLDLYSLTVLTMEVLRLYKKLPFEKEKCLYVTVSAAKYR